MSRIFPVLIFDERFGMRGGLRALLGIACALVLAACGGGGGGGSGGASGGTAAPTLVAQPQSVRANDGQPANFSVAAVGTAPLTYQWSRGGTAIPGATSAAYTIATTQLSDNGASFTVTVTNGAGSVQSSAATLTVDPVAPSIADNTPKTVSVLAGQTATFGVSASGSLPLSFQWRRTSVAIPGATSASYTTPATVASDNGAVFDVVVSNVAGSITSAPFTLNVTVAALPPSIVTPPSSQTVRAGNPATFSVTAGGTAPLSYQWLRNGSAIAGALASSYTLTSAALADSGAQFSVTVTNAAGSITSGAATLTVLPQPAIALFVGNVGGSGNIDGTGVAARFASPSSVAIDNGGNVYVADTASHTIRKITTAGVVSTFAGSPGVQGSADGSGRAALFNVPIGVAVDSTGNVLVADNFNSTIRKITPAGVVTTLAGTAGVVGSADGTGATASFNFPTGVAADSAGNVYVADSRNHTIRKISAGGVVTTVAGSPGSAGTSDGTGSAARFNAPWEVAVDGASNVYVADSSNDTIRKISPAGAVTTLAGSPGVRGSTDGVGSAALFDTPTGIAVDGAGNVYVGDGFNRIVRKVTAAGVVTTIAGAPGVNGSADGTGSAASLSSPVGVASDVAGVVYVADRENFAIRRITTSGVVTTIAGAAGIKGSVDGAGSAASFNRPYGIAVDAAGNFYVSDANNFTIRKVTAAGVVTTLAGNPGLSGSADGFGRLANFADPRGLAVDAAGNVYVADNANNTIRKISPAAFVTTLAGSPVIGGSADGIGIAASFNGPSAIAVDASGNLYVTDTINSTIRKITPAAVVTTFAGTAGRIGASDGIGAAASFNLPTGISIDAGGNLSVVDTGNGTIRKISSGGVGTTLAGTAGRVGSADGAPGAASFNLPTGITLDGAGNAYVADTNNRTLRKIDAAGNVTTVVGVADGLSGVRLGALPGHLSRPIHPVFDSAGNLYCTDVNGVLKITLP